MPAASTTFRSVSSPHWPRTPGRRNASDSERGLVVERRELLRELPAQALPLALERAHLLLKAPDQLVVGAPAGTEEVDSENGAEGDSKGEGEHGDHAARVLLRSDGLQRSLRAEVPARFWSKSRGFPSSCSQSSDHEALGPELGRTLREEGGSAGVAPRLLLSRAESAVAGLRSGKSRFDQPLGPFSAIDAKPVKPSE
jgi:hypothetical protein